MESLEEEHYAKPEVGEEISRFARNRWIGIHCVKTDDKGNRLMVRYIDKKPITISSPEDVYLLYQRLKNKGLRTIYATAAVYGRLSSIEDLFSLDNIIFYTPTWDVDNIFEYWKSTIKACMEIVDALREEGVEKSIYIKWSGNGAHVHLHERAIDPKSFKGRSPLDVAYAIVEYIIMKVEPRIYEISLSDECNMVVENKVDRQRMFTCPLSLHRDYDRVCICMKPNQLSYFNQSWVEPKNYVHNKNWWLYEEGEADSLAEKAMNTIGGYPSKRSRRRKYPKLDEAIIRWLNL